MRGHALLRSGRPSTRSASARASALPDSADLERARIFGPAGDLELRREGPEYRWRIVGEPGKVQPPAGFASEDFWPAHPGAEFWEFATSAMLWGAYDRDLNCWREDRVGRAPLEYPVDPSAILADTSDSAKKKPRIGLKLKGVRFLDGGQVAFVWWKELCIHAAG